LDLTQHRGKDKEASQDLSKEETGVTSRFHIVFPSFEALVDDHITIFDSMIVFVIVINATVVIRVKNHLENTQHGVPRSPVGKRIVGLSIPIGEPLNLVFQKKTKAKR
jgi:hypothetical protein